MAGSPLLVAGMAVLAAASLAGCRALDGGTAGSSAATAPRGAAEHALVRGVDALLAHPDLAGAWVALRVETAGGRIVADRNGATRMMPASNMKLVTTACALDVLGSEFAFTTRVMADGVVVGDRLEGDLCLVGGGDPTLVMQDLRDLAAAVRAAGIREVTGRLLGDDSIYDQDRYGENWSVGYLERYYAAPISGLSLNKNVVDFWFLPGPQEGDPVTFRTEPVPEYLELVNQAVTTRAAPDEPSLYLEREAWTPRVRLTGQIRPGAAEFEEAVTVADATHFTLFMFRRALDAAGVEVAGGLRFAPAPVGAALVAEHRSAPLREIVRPLNKRSDNHCAEQLFRMLGRQARGAGTRESAAAVVAEWLGQVVGVDSGDVDMADGSGLSRLDLVTARALCAVLRFMQRHPAGNTYLDSLPLAGVDGTLDKRMQDGPARGRIHAKTGYIGSVRTLSGYVQPQEPQPWPVFSMLVNHYAVETDRVNALQDGICHLLALWAGGASSQEIAREAAKRAGVAGADAD